ncbi:YoaK family protein [Isoptericola sp. b441]|uniref:YoaK family protein n=1 Tax=Actinotalea lenta TaxID=3064654 RepID=A0ABT9D843_9CELL|nr:MULTISPECIES: YoaK family protein [unclassified Isoptericola]MDO8107040.1 YoaK family protein [Isoptericola sp. b441]MDO8121251.1 YoaK family protein [Isoptericola sp. b490]
MSDTSPRSERGAERSTTERVLAVVGFTVVAGCVDVVTYVGLGKVFTANMTGNTVLLGIGLATGDLGAAARAGVALAGFVAGAVVVGAAVPVARHRRAVLQVLTGELVLMSVLSAWWLTTGGESPTGALRYGLVALAGVAMGAQSGVVRHLDVPVNTTYITGTWTALSAGAGSLLRGRRRQAAERPSSSVAQQVVVVATYLAAAFGAAAAYQAFGARVAVLPPVLLLAAMLPWLARPGFDGASTSEGRSG